MASRASASRARPTAPRVRPTATTWAKYQVDPSDAAYQRTVPAPTKTVEQVADGRPDREAPQEPEREPDVERPDDDGQEGLVDGEAPEGHEREQQDGGQRREGDQPPAGRGARRVDRGDHVVEVVVACRPGDRVGDGGVALQPGLRLPDEVVVDRLLAGPGQLVEDEAGQDEAQADDDRRPGPRGRRGEKGAPAVGGRALGYTPVHLSARSRRPNEQPVPGPAAGESARAGEQARVGVRDAIVPLAVLLALGLALRLIIAYVLLPGSGFKVDVGSFNGWAMELARNGPGASTTRPLFVDYTPGYLYVLWGLGLVSQALGIPVEGLLKLPAIVADLGLGAGRLRPGRRPRGEPQPGAPGGRRLPLRPDHLVRQRGLVAGRLGRDARPRARGPRALAGRSERAALLTTIAAIIKPQFGILIPLAAVVIIRRHWVERPDDGSRLGGGPSGSSPPPSPASSPQRWSACPSAWRSSRSPSWASPSSRASWARSSRRPPATPGSR